MFKFHSNPRLFVKYFLEVIRIFLGSFYAFCASLDSFTWSDCNPLQIRMLLLFYCWIVVSAQKYPFYSETACFFTNLANHIDRLLAIRLLAIR